MCNTIHSVSPPMIQDQIFSGKIYFRMNLWGVVLLVLSMLDTESIRATWRLAQNRIENRNSDLLLSIAVAVNWSKSVIATLLSVMVKYIWNVNMAYFSTLLLISAIYNKQQPIYKICTRSSYTARHSASISMFNDFVFFNKIPTSFHSYSKEREK